MSRNFNGSLQQGLKVKQSFTCKQKHLNEVEILQNKNAELQKEIERLKAIGNNDGTTAGIPTSMTPLNKKKVIPNFAKNTGGKNWPKIRS